MTLQIDGTDVMAVIEIAAWVGSIVAMLVVGLIVYLMVRPVRRRPDTRVREPEALDVEEMARLLDRMEQRLMVLERAVEVQAGDRNELLETGEGPETRRMK